MKYFSAVIVLCFFVLISCNDSKEDKTIVQATDTQSVHKVYGDDSFTFPELLEETEVELEKWAVFQEFEQEALKVNNSYLAQLQIQSKLVIAHSDSLVKKIPNTFYTNPVVSRLKVVQTRIKLLESEVLFQKIDTLKIQSHVMEFNVAFANLLNELNETIQKNKIDALREESDSREIMLQKQQLDSIYQQELKDNN